MGVMIKAETQPLGRLQGLTLTYEEQLKLPNERTPYMKGDYLFHSSPYGDTRGLIKEMSDLLAEATVHIWQLDRETIDYVLIDEELAENPSFVRYLQQIELMRVYIKDKMSHDLIEIVNLGIRVQFPYSIRAPATFPPRPIL